MEPKQIDWTEMLGNPYRYGLNPQMLGDNGYVHHACTRVRGGTKNKQDVIPVEILFDEEYVMSYIQKMIFEKLQPTNYNDFQKLISKVWRQWKESAQANEK